jgi:putative addiction module component (TIGR02574 family)
MPARVEFRDLPIDERLKLIEDIWDSIADDPERLPDTPSVVKEVRERKARYLANPQNASSWETAKKNIRS